MTIDAVIKTRWVQFLWIAVLFLIPVILWVLPSDYFDESQTILCPSRKFFDIECWGCGITRAVQHMHHFEFSDALFFNNLVVVVYPAMVIIWMIWVRNAFRRLKA